MRKLYEEKEVLFAVLWIVVYCLVLTPLKGNFGLDSAAMLAALIIFTAGICLFVGKNHLTKKYGLSEWPKDMGKYLFFIPMWILATGNLWAGFALSYQGVSLVIAVLSMMLIGFVEEMIFRGFLFRAMLANGNKAAAIIVSSLTVGIGQFVNLFAGQASFATAMPVIFAVIWGFILTMVFYKSKSLIPCIIAHAMIDVFSVFGAENRLVDQIYILATVIVGIVYCIYLSRIKEADAE